MIEWLMVGVLGGLAHAAPLMLESGSHCVAYRAQKTTLMILKGSDVIGKNCDIAAQVLPEVGGLFHIEVVIPIRSFQSGDKGLDEDMIKALKADVQPDLTFRSRSLTADKWRALFAQKEFEVVGDLQIGKKSYPLKLNSHYLQTVDNAEVDGIAKVKFQDYEIAPPQVVGGLVAKTNPELELHFHLSANRILGADSIRLGKAPDPLEEVKDAVKEESKEGH
jgi:hypothetical protein